MAAPIEPPLKVRSVRNPADPTTKELAKNGYFGTATAQQDIPFSTKRPTWLLPAAVLIVIWMFCRLVAWAVGQWIP